MRYTEQQIGVLLQTSMRDILAAEGYDTSHTSGGLFFSPFREKERTPSFHIDDVRHKWFDHGDGFSGGGDVIAFVRRLKGLDFVGACDYLCRYNPSVVPDIHVDVMKVPRTKDRILGGGTTRNANVEVTVDGVAPRFADGALVAYAASRGISGRVLDAVCSEVSYSVIVTDTDTGEQRRYRHRAIGFANAGGGWTLRYNPVAKRDKGKRSTGGGYSAISCRGMNMAEGHVAPSSASVVVFEGFMDYMSWLELYRRGGRPDDTDVVVLNSVSNLRQALPFILQHANVIGILDADKAGDAATALLEAECRTAAPRVRFFDKRRLILKGYKDVNDRLCAMLKENG